jgi:Flp pilus assembly protein TadG
MTRWRLFRKANDGAAAVEFALLLPLMISLFFGVVETTMALLCRADVSIMASTAADLISQESTTNTADLTNIYSGSGQPTIRITSVIYDTGSPSTTSGKVAWTCTQTGSGTLSPASRNVGDTVTFGPPLMSATQALMTANGSMIIAEVAYNYASPTTQVITGGINMTNNFYAKPRRVAQIPAPTGGCP